MNSAKKGDRVSVDYWGTLDNGTQFDSSEGKQPLEFTIGAGEMIEGFDKAIIGMKVGEAKKITIKPEEAYGEKNEEMIADIPIERLRSSGINPKKGLQLNANGQIGTVISVSKEKARIDFNHPLAGKTLNFKIKLLKIK